MPLALMGMMAVLVAPMMLFGVIAFSIGAATAMWWPISLPISASCRDFGGE